MCNAIRAVTNGWKLPGCRIIYIFAFSTFYCYLDFSIADAQDIAEIMFYWTSSTDVWLEQRQSSLVMWVGIVEYSITTQSRLTFVSSFCILSNFFSFNALLKDVTISLGYLYIFIYFFSYIFECFLCPQTRTASEPRWELPSPRLPFVPLRKFWLRQMPKQIFYSNTGPWMRQAVGFGDRSTGKVTFGGKFGAHHCNQWRLYGVRVRQCLNRIGCGLGFCVRWAEAFPVSYTHLTLPTILRV